MTYFLELCKHLLTDLTQLDMTRYTISIPLWEVRQKEILRKVLKMASTTGFPGMIDAHTFSLDWQVLLVHPPLSVEKKWIHLAAGQRLQ